jgi:hypothetical protein
VKRSHPAAYVIGVFDTGSPWDKKDHRLPKTFGATRTIRGYPSSNAGSGTSLCVTY